VLLSFRIPFHSLSIPGNENYIRNLYFLYLLELRALSKIAPYLMTRVNWQSSGDSAATREAIKNLLENVRSELFSSADSITGIPPLTSRLIHLFLFSIFLSVLFFVSRSGRQDSEITLQRD
jgi:hypothetical protein